MTLRAALSLALLVLGLPGQAADGTAQARLDEAKEAMVDAALSQPTRVRSAAWIDESGVLHEQTRFQSQGGIRGIRMPSYLPKDATQKSEGEPAGPMLAAEPVAAAAAPSPTNAADEDACPALPGLMQSAVLVLEPRTPQGPGQAATPGPSKQKSAACLPAVSMVSRAGIWPPAIRSVPCAHLTSKRSTTARKTAAPCNSRWPLPCAKPRPAAPGGPWGPERSPPYGTVLDPSDDKRLP